MKKLFNLLSPLSNRVCLTVAPLPPFLLPSQNTPPLSAEVKNVPSPPSHKTIKLSIPPPRRFARTCLTPPLLHSLSRASTHTKCARTDTHTHRRTLSQIRHAHPSFALQHPPPVASSTSNQREHFTFVNNTYTCVAFTH